MRLAKDAIDTDALEVIAGNLYWGRSNSGSSWDGIQQRLSGLKSDLYWVKIQRANSLIRENKEEDAISVLTSAKKDYFPDPAASYLLSYIYIQRFQLGLARAETEGALATYPDNPRLLNQGMFIALMQHDETAASRDFSHLSEVVGSGGQQIASACLYYYGIGECRSG
jgi:tetratricopeptide (TPR) repeat protein